MLLVLVGVLGLAVGSFVNVVISRVPLGESMVSPPSRCPSCQAPIRGRHNVPVVGWLMLRGRCADCRAPIAVRYPLVELVTAVVFVAVAAKMQDLRLVGALPAMLYFSAVGIALAVIDLTVRRLPNVIVLSTYPILAVLLTGASLVQHDSWALARAAIGCAALFGFFFALALAYPAGMGYGDVKLAGVLGLILGYLSWSALLVGAFAGFLFGALAGLAVLASRRGGRKSAIPFGPFMVAGALVAILGADVLARVYRPY